MAKHNDPSAFDLIFGGAANAIADVRSKLIDEGWFGRSTAEMPPAAWIDTPIVETIDLSFDEVSFEDLWAAAPTIELEDVSTEIADLGSDLGLDF